MTEHMVDIEPTWVALGRLMIKEQFSGQLDPALKIADIVRQAQKRGSKSVTFKFKGNQGDIDVFEDDGQ
jgi:TRAP-type mannitol/chloroaromatic compound transport system substrate-binding protein